MPSFKLLFGCLLVPLLLPAQGYITRPAGASPCGALGQVQTFLNSTTFDCTANFAYNKTALAAPVLGTITHGGTAGMTTYTYAAYAFNAVGFGVKSAVATTTTGNATLSSMNTNIIPVGAVPGSTYCIVFNTINETVVSPSPFPACGTAVTDTGAATSFNCCSALAEYGGTIDYSVGLSLPNGVLRADHGFYSDPIGALQYMTDSPESQRLFISCPQALCESSVVSSVTGNTNSNGSWDAFVTNINNPIKAVLVGDFRMFGELPDMGAPVFEGFGVFDDIDNWPLFQTVGATGQGTSIVIGAGAGITGTYGDGQIWLGADSTFNVCPAAPCFHNVTILLKGGLDAGTDPALQERDVNRTTVNWSITHGGQANLSNEVLGGNVVNPFVMVKNTQAATAPTAGNASLRWIAGTNAGTCKLVGAAGTSATEVVIVDNVGGGC